MISVIIPIYIIDEELRKLTEDCIESYFKHTSDGNELIIVDNASPIKDKNNWGADVYIRNNNNHGNAVAWNQGLRIARGDYLLLSDNDVLFSENWEGLADKKAITFPLTKCREENDFTQKLSGFFWMLSRGTYKKLGDVSEEYGIANFEDTDYFMRAQKMGIQLKCNPNTKILHHGRATCDKVPDVKEIWHKNERLYRQKYEGQYPTLN